MGLLDSVKSLGSSAGWKNLASNALNYGSKALNFVSPFAGAAADVGLGVWNNHQQYKQAQGLNKLQFGLNKQFNEWLIPYQLGQEYEFAARYAKNSPKWNVKGLRKAGLNPILAASGGFSGGNAPHSSVGFVGSGGSTNPSLRMDVLSAINAHKHNQLLDAEIEGQKIKNNNELQNRGLTGQYGALSRLISETGISKDDPVSPHRPKDYSNVLDSIGEILGYKFGNDGKSKPNPYIKTSPRTIDADILKRANEDIPPSMIQHQKYIESDGFNLREWHRSKNKSDGKYRYRRREPWEKIYRW